MKAERRAHNRFPLRLPLTVKRIADTVEPICPTIHTVDISSRGVCFLAEHTIEPGTAIELEIDLEPRVGDQSARISAFAHVIRAEINPVTGWYELAASFDEVLFGKECLHRLATHAATS